jgi:hypothetical protein
MASVVVQTLKNLTKHNVGSLNQWEKDLLNQGAKVSGGAIDNYCLGTLGFNAKGERIVTALADQTKKGVLVASVEDYMQEYETMAQFYNEVDEYARIVYQTPNHHFEASNFELADSAKPIKNGQVVHYDITKKKYIISNGTGDHADYATAGNKYIVVNVPDYTLAGLSVVRFEIA